jgi:ubiquinone/menaquinone biosynthesis C-methylase UbiE
MQLNTVNFTAPVPSVGGFLDPQKIVGDLGVMVGMRVSDFGSGAGHFTILLAKAVGESGLVTAIDLMDSALETLKSKAKLEAINNIETVRSDLEAVGGSSLANDSQDIVLIANSLFQNQRKDAIIEEAKRVLKPGGSLVIIEWRKGALGFGPPDSLRTTPEEMQNMATSKGFQFVREVDTGTFHYGIILKKV